MKRKTPWVDRSPPVQRPYRYTPAFERSITTGAWSLGNRRRARLKSFDCARIGLPGLARHFYLLGGYVKNIRWGWVLLGGLLAELVVFAIVIPLSFLAGRESLPYSASPASFVATFAFGLWVAQKSPQRRVLHGILVGVVATLIYVGTSLGRPEPIAYVVAHVLKVLGGAAGGFVALKRGAAKAGPNAPVT